MQYNFFLLQALCPWVEKSIRGFTLVSCFSQNKDELVLEFNDSASSFFIRALLAPAFSCITFPPSFHRARKNSIDLFTDALMRPAQKAEVVPNERSFVITLGGDYRLLFKMHGNRANILLLHEGRVTAIFKQQMVADRAVTLPLLARTIDWSEAAFHTNINQLPKHYPVLDKWVWNYLAAQGFQQADDRRKWEIFQACIARLQHPVFYIVDWQGTPAFSLLPVGTIVQEFNEPLRALNEFCARYLAQTGFQRAKAAMVAELQREQTKLEAQLAEATARLAFLTTDHHYQQWADILMANLHRVEPGAAALEAENFYDANRLVHIPIKKELSAQKNAETFYRKSKNQAIERRQLQTTVTTKTAALREVAARLRAVERATELIDLDAFQTKRTAAAQSKALPYHTHLVNGFELMVGKNAAANDLLLRMHARKNDLWLHAKDAPGSHVIIRQQAGKEFPRAVIERAAALAAYYSKRKTEGLVPVAYTLCKYVRKRKGDPPGAVVAEREETLLIPPAP